MYVQKQKMNQKGFSVLELLVVIAVGGILLSGVVLGIFQVSQGTIHNRGQLVSMTDVNNAAYWIKRELQMAQYSNLTDGDPLPQSSLSIYWIDMTLFPTGDQATHSSQYYLSGTDLLRTRDGETSIVSRHITNIGFTRNGTVVKCFITASVSGITQQTETLEFIVRTRSEEVL